jgi:hypothetical protein
MTELTCTLCAKACRLDVEREADGGIRVSGNSCPKGEEFALKNTDAFPGAAEKAAGRPEAGREDPADRWNRRCASGELDAIRDGWRTFHHMLRHRRRAIRPAQWRRIQSVLDRSFREISALLND